MSQKLTYNLILSKHKTESLNTIKYLNLWGNNLEDVEIIKNMTNLEIVTLSNNNVSSLKDFADLKNLKELYLRKNSISQLEELSYLKNCKDLKILWLEDNPICEIEDYRKKVVRLLPQLNKLDNKNIFEVERKISGRISRLTLDSNLFKENQENSNKAGLTDDSNTKRIIRKISGTTKFQQNKKIRLSISNSKQVSLNKSSHLNCNEKSLNNFQFNFGSSRIRTNKIRIISDSDNEFNKENINFTNISNFRLETRTKQSDGVIAAIENLLSSLNDKQLIYIKSLVDQKLNM